MLPESMLCTLENYGFEKFAETFLGNFDTPEVKWKHEMRKHAVEMVMQHLGDLPLTLTENVMNVYEFCPIPTIRYNELDDELWCHNYYLKALTDEAKFGDWPIPEPVELLRAVLDAWCVPLLPI